MDPITLGLLGGGVLSNLMGIFGGGSDAGQYTQKAIEELIKVKIPDPAMQKLALERFQSAGQLTPELEDAIKQDPSAFESIVKNQKYAQAQDRALSQLQEEGENGGLRLQDKAAIQEQEIQNAVKDRGNRQAITDDMARRGTGGSGMELQAQLQGAQAAGDRDSQSRLKIMADAQDRGLQAIMGAGDLAGKLGDQDYKHQSDLATARDRINEFNTQNAQGVEQRNTGTQNQAQAANLEARQKLMNDNTSMANDEQKYNKSLEQQRFENEMKKAQAVSGAYSGAAGQANQDAAQKRANFGAVGNTLTGVGSTYQASSNYNDWLKRLKGGS